MEVKNKLMYHLHTLGCYDEVWQEKQILNITDNFPTYYSKYFPYIGTGKAIKSGEIISFDQIINAYLNDDALNLKMAKQLLKDAKTIIRDLSIIERESVLEKIRSCYYPTLPSRNHSIWVCDEQNISFWGKNIRSTQGVLLFEVLLTGNLFKTSANFLPKEGLSFIQMAEQAHKYWHPVFTNADDEEKAEYLFQGKLEIVRKL